MGHDHFYGRCLGWENKFAWFPEKCFISGKRIWLENAYRGTRIIHGLAGESPVVIHRWHNEQEHIFWKLKNE